LAQRADPTPGQPDKQPMPIPLRTALIGDGGEIASERLILLDKAEQSIRFDDVAEPALLSINRGFSAPVIVEAERGPDELERLARHDSDPFACFEAMQELMLRTLIAGTLGDPVDTEPLVRAVANTLRSDSLDDAFKAEVILPPSEAQIGDRMERVDPDAIHSAREGLRATIGSQLRDDLLRTRAGNIPDDLSPAAKGARRLGSVALGLLAAGDPREGASLAKAQFDSAANMTERQAALAVLVSLDQPEREAALEAFYERFKDDPLVLDKWFALQATAQRAETVDEVERLAAHPVFTIANPNRLRALAGTFSANQWAFHHASGRGYRFVADMVLTADRLNPQVAARLVPAFGRWRRFDDDRATRMRAELERIVAAPSLSRDTYEQVTRSLG
jgi:aminopeptidase N